MPGSPDISVEIALTAQRQVWSLVEHYDKHGRDLAAQYLLRAVDEARNRIAANPQIGTAYPRPYRAISASGHRWFKVHRYWFAFRLMGTTAIITNVFFETADIARRMDL